VAAESTEAAAGNTEAPAAAAVGSAATETPEIAPAVALAQATSAPAVEVAVVKKEEVPAPAKAPIKKAAKITLRKAPVVKRLPTVSKPVPVPEPEPESTPMPMPVLTGSVAGVIHGGKYRDRAAERRDREHGEPVDQGPIPSFAEAAQLDSTRSNSGFSDSVGQGSSGGLGFTSGGSCPQGLGRPTGFSNGLPPQQQAPSSPVQPPAGGPVQGVIRGGRIRIRQQIQEPIMPDFGMSEMQKAALERFNREPDYRGL